MSLLYVICYMFRCRFKYLKFYPFICLLYVYMLTIRTTGAFLLNFLLKFTLLQDIFLLIYIDQNAFLESPFQDQIPL